MQIIAISDTHGKHRDVELPRGDVLVHAGDFTVGGEKSATLDFVNWFSVQPFEHKLFIAGNHDLWAESHEEELTSYANEQGVHYLCNSAVEIAGLTFWGSPQTPRFMDWAFMYSPGGEAESQWNQVPESVDVLVTHGPPKGILDGLYVAPDPGLNSSGDFGAGVTNAVKSSPYSRLQSVGCDALAKRIMQVKPRLHLFGHIHEAFGSMNVGRTQFVNASVMDRHYKLANPPHHLDVSDVVKSGNVTSNDFSDKVHGEEKLPNGVKGVNDVGEFVLDPVG